MTGVDDVTLFPNLPGLRFTPRFDTAKGLEGVAACDAVLALLPQKHWMRRVSLLRAKALHRLQLGDAAGALADLDLAKAAAQDDPHYARSQGLGLEMARGLALRLAGKQADAETVVMAALRARPLSRQVAASAAVALGPGASPANKIEAAQALARLFSERIDPAYMATFDAFRFADVVAMYSQEPVTLSTGGAPIYRTIRGGMYAYALAAQGRGAEARAAIAAIRAGLSAPPQAHAADENDSSPATEGQGHATVSPKANDPDASQALEEWNTLVERRILVTEGKYAEVLKLNADHPPAEGWAAVELGEAVRAIAPAALRTKLPSLDGLRAKLRKDEETDAADPDSLYESLPDAETADTLSPYGAAGAGLFGGNSGYGTVHIGDMAATTVTFRSTGHVGTPAMVEEMALLRAAELARAAGKKGIVILTRLDNSFYTDAEPDGKLTHAKLDGYFCRLSVDFVDLDALPDAYKGNAWRVLDADAVYAQLAPIYLPKK